jgi:hypothetical protein
MGFKLLGLYSVEDALPYIKKDGENGISYLIHSSSSIAQHSIA